MGLDIYGYIVKRARKNRQEPIFYTIKEASDLMDKRAKDRFAKFAKRSLNILKNTDADGYVDAYGNIFSKMKNYTRYEFTYERMMRGAKPVEEVEQFFADFLKRYYAESDVYFRKVNFVYRYFEDGLDDECCFVTKGEMEDLVDRCNKVLGNNDLAEELLPTRSGFFFGSTDYDEWYFEDLKDCKKQFEKVLKRFNEDTDLFYMVFSW